MASQVGRTALDTVNRMRNPPPLDPPPIEGGWVVLDEEDGPTSDSDDTAKADEDFHNGGLFDPEPLNVGYVVPCASSEEDSQEDRESDDGAAGEYDDGLCGSWDASGSAENELDAAHAEPTPRASNSTALPAPRQSEPCSPRDQAETTEGVGRDGNISAIEGHPTPKPTAEAHQTRSGLPPRPSSSRPSALRPSWPCSRHGAVPVPPLAARSPSSTSPTPDLPPPPSLLLPSARRPPPPPEPEHSLPPGALFPNPTEQPGRAARPPVHAAIGVAQRQEKDATPSGTAVTPAAGPSIGWSPGDRGPAPNPRGVLCGGHGVGVGDEPRIDLVAPGAGVARVDGQYDAVRPRVKARIAEVKRRFRQGDGVRESCGNGRGDKDGG